LRRAARSIRCRQPAARRPVRDAKGGTDRRTNADAAPGAAAMEGIDQAQARIVKPANTG
jgi:hypothetical protein